MNDLHTHFDHAIYTLFFQRPFCWKSMWLPSALGGHQICKINLHFLLGQDWLNKKQFEMIHKDTHLKFLNRKRTPLKFATTKTKNSEAGSSSSPTPFFRFQCEKPNPQTSSFTGVFGVFVHVFFVEEYYSLSPTNPRIINWIAQNETLE